MRITGSAVVTTRLSRETMNSATEVIANVQRVRAVVVMTFLLIRDQSLSYTGK